QRNDAFTYVWDIMPTILDIAEVEYPAELQGRELAAPRGRSMLGLLNGTKERIYDEQEFVGGEMGGGKWMRQGDFKAMTVPRPYGDGTWKLFNVEKDPGEAQDLAQAMPDKLETLIAAWNDYADDVGVILAN
ncbi:MAG: arylsulfatase, partial [Gammaproteobacteria bacterium]